MEAGAAAVCGAVLTRAARGLGTKAGCACVSCHITNILPVERQKLGEKISGFLVFCVHGGLSGAFCSFKCANFQICRFVWERSCAIFLNMQLCSLRSGCCPQVTFRGTKRHLFHLPHIYASISLCKHLRARASASFAMRVFCFEQKAVSIVVVF